MKEDLGMLGNQLNYMQTAWSVGYVLGGVPSNILLTRVRPSLFIPCIEIMWAVLTFSLVACKSWQTMCAVRFFVGLFESALFPGFIYIIG
jgi:MFS transporter, ACS family, pantothenate transporter